MAAAQQRGMGQFYVLAAAVLWGTTGTAQALAPQGCNSLVIGASRMLIASLILLPLAFSRGDLQRVTQCRFFPLFMAAAFSAGYQLCFFSAVAKTGVAVGTVVGISSSPIAGGLLGYLFRSERLYGRWFVAITLAITGCALLTITGNESVHIDPVGILLAIGSGCCYAGMALVLKETLETANPMGVMALVFTLAALMLFPALLLSDLRWLWQPRALMVMAHLGIVATVFPYLFFAKGIQTTTISTATVLTLAEPMTATTLGIVLLGERLDFQSCLGLASIFLGLAFLIFMEQWQHRKNSGACL